MKVKIDERTLKELEFNRIVEKLKSYAQSAPGKEELSNPDFYSSRFEIEYALALVSEMKNLLGIGEEIDFYDIVSLDKVCEHIDKGGVLGKEDLYLTGKCLGNFHRVKQVLKKNKEITPKLELLIGKGGEFKLISSSILDIFDENGEIKDDASEELFEIRLKEKSLKEKIRKILKDFLLDQDLLKYLQSDYYTLREDRYCLPVISSFQKRVPGIIHGRSNTLETVYIEPELIVDLNNELKIVIEQKREEEYKILMEFSKMLKDFTEDIRKTQRIVAKIEAIYAKAKLSIDWKMEEVAVTDEPGFTLIDARNPLLLFYNQKVVPNTFKLKPPVSMMIISGPNAGGKTVALKTVGLCFLMMLSGNHIPASRDSELYIPGGIFTAMGEQQDISLSLSTFSGHLKRLQYIMDNSEENSLVLIDEIMAATEPNEGSALAMAYLKLLVQRKRVKGAVTTHYELLKTLPYHEDGFVNCAMGFDDEAGKPTYKLIYGVPGTSSPLKIADEVGFDREVIKEASAYLGGERGSISDIIIKMQKQLNLLEKTKKHYEKLIEDVLSLKEEYKEKLEKLKREGKKQALSYKERLLKRVFELEEELRGIIKSVQKKVTPEVVRRKRVRISEIKDELKQSAEKDKSDLYGDEVAKLKLVDPEKIRPGTKVFLKKFGKTGEVISVNRLKRFAIVGISGFSVKAYFYELFEAPEVSPLSFRKSNIKLSQGSAEGKVTSSDEERETIRTDENTIKLIGMRVHDALLKLESFLDKKYLEQREYVYIIHGIGTGALKNAVREFLKESPYVSSFKKADQSEGGDGVTIAFLRE